MRVSRTLCLGCPRALTPRDTWAGGRPTTTPPPFTPPYCRARPLVPSHPCCPSSHPTSPPTELCIPLVSPAAFRHSQHWVWGNPSSLPGKPSSSECPSPPAASAPRQGQGTGCKWTQWGVPPPLPGVCCPTGEPGHHRPPSRQQRLCLSEQDQDQQSTAPSGSALCHQTTPGVAHVGKGEDPSRAGIRGTWLVTHPQVMNNHETCRDTNGSAGTEQNPALARDTEYYSAGMGWKGP